MPMSREKVKVNERTEDAPTQAEALAVAEACARLLRERFGARRVIPFGSVVGQGPWHADSDIDLAVEGIPPEQLLHAWSALREVLPLNLEVDLVPLESAHPEMRARILGEVEMPEDPTLALKSLIEDELIALERVAQEMDDLLAECAQPPTRTELRAIASILHEFYNGVERIFERIAVGLGEGLPQGSYWHAELLNQMAISREGIRPAVIEEPLRARLKDYLDFRHFFRHAYGYTLEWSQMRWKASNVMATLVRLRTQLEAFFETLGEEGNSGVVPQS